MKYLSVIVFIFCGLGLGYAQEYEGLIREFDGYAEAALRDWNTPGMAVVVVKDGKVLLNKGYGKRHIARQEQVDAQTIFACASTTKAMTAALMGMLVDEGKLRWDDRVVDYLPAFRVADPYVTQSIRIRDLFTHNTGLGNADYLWAGSELGSDEIMARLKTLPQAYPLRGGYTYQNIMYLVAGEIIKKVSGKSWEDMLKTRLFEPLGMARSYATYHMSKDESNRSQAHYRLRSGEILPIPDLVADGIGPAGSAWSCTQDMARWLTFLLDSARVNGSRLLNPSTYAEWFTPQILIPQTQFYPSVVYTQPNWTSYGLGWFQHDYQGRKVNFHTGSLDGTVAICGLLPSEKLGIYVFGNLDHAELRHALMYKLFDLFISPKSTGRDWSADLRQLYARYERQADSARKVWETGRIPGTQPSKALEAYQGIYTHASRGEITVKSSPDGLVVQVAPIYRLQLKHWHYDTFQGVYAQKWEDPAYVSFHLDARGNVQGLRINEGELFVKK